MRLLTMFLLWRWRRVLNELLHIVGTITDNQAQSAGISTEAREMGRLVIRLER